MNIEVHKRAAGVVGDGVGHPRLREDVDDRPPRAERGAEGHVPHRRHDGSLGHPLGEEALGQRGDLLGGKIALDEVAAGGGNPADLGKAEVPGVESGLFPGAVDLAAGGEDINFPKHLRVYSPCE